MTSEPSELAVKPQKHHRPVQSGLSVLARGESFVWLTGGMLVVAIGMIVTLLGFVFYRGMQTFWPQPFAVYPVQSGSLVAGEPQSVESFTYEASQLNSLSEPARQAAIARLGSSSTATANRTYLRVGNFDLSGQHFDYLNEFEQTTDKPLYPEQIWVVERLHNGRFYGWPVQLHESFDPVFDDRFKQLTSARDLIPLLAGYASESIEFDQTKSDAIQEKLTKELQAVANAFFQKVFDGTPLHEGEHWEAQVNDDWQRVTPPTVPEGTSKIRLVANSYASIQHAFHTAKGSISGLVKRSEDLQEELAHNDEKLKDARLDLRQAEIDSKLTFLDRVSEIETDWATISIAKLQLQEQKVALKSLNENASLSAEEKGTLTKLFEAMENDYQSQIQQMQAALDETMKNFADLPPECIAAIKRYQETVSQSAASQTSLNTEIASTEAEIKSAVIQFRSTHVESLQDLSEEQAKQITSSKETQQLASNMWWKTEPTENGVEVRFVSKSDQKWQEAILQPAEIEVSEIVRAYLPNQLSLTGKLSIMGSRWGEFVTGRPREAGMEGGFFPAIWGTVVMTMIMAVFVVPFGVLAALYLREYATSGLIVGILRIAINNLAGVPSVVYGVFGLAFFCYTVGGYIDGGPQRAGIEAWPPAQWYLMLALVAALSVAAFFLSFYCSGSPMAMSTVRRWGRSISGIVWVASVIGFVVLIAKSPFFDGFFEANLPNPTFGKGGLVWASLTLALLTLPVVIVATEEALSAVPNSLREGSYACGAGKWQTIQRIVLPHARPGIMTGTILAMARGAGEVAPMMLVGALPLAVELPLDGEFPFFHGSRSFMHLGFQIYALGFQGQNSEAAKPMVFTTTLLLILIVLLLNLVAIILRTRLRKRFQGVQF